MPGSVYGTLLENALIPDPYYRDNELLVLPLMENDFVYSTVLRQSRSCLPVTRLFFALRGLTRLHKST